MGDIFGLVALGKLNSLGETKVVTDGGTFTFDANNHITMATEILATGKIAFPELDAIEFKVVTGTKWVLIKVNPSDTTQFLAVNTKGLTNRDVIIQNTSGATLATAITGSSAAQSAVGDTIKVEIFSDRITFSKNGVFWFDTLNTLISTYADWTTTLGFIAPDAASYVVAQYFRPYNSDDLTAQLVEIDTKLTSKHKYRNWMLHGDSITWYDGQAFPDTTTCIGYPTHVINATGIVKQNNYAISGASMAEGPTYPTNGSISTSGLTRTMTSTDVVTIFAGTNDFKLNVPMGTLGAIGDVYADLVVTEFYGSYRKLIEYILTNRPSCKIYLMTPIQRDASSYDVNTTNTAGHKLIDYVTAVKAIGNMYGLPVLDLFATSGITKLTLTTFCIDGLHPNNAGQLRLAEMIIPFMENN